jgi:hypothetical protein
MPALLDSLPLPPLSDEWVPPIREAQRTKATLTSGPGKESSTLQPLGLVATVGDRPSVRAEATADVQGIPDASDLAGRW